MEEVLQLQSYIPEWQAQGLDVVLVSADRPDRLEAFLEEHGLQLTVLLDREGRAGQAYRVQGLPAGFALDRDGVIRHQTVGWGPGSFEQMLNMVEDLLTE